MPDSGLPKESSDAAEQGDAEDSPAVGSNSGPAQQERQFDAEMLQKDSSRHRKQPRGESNHSRRYQLVTAIALLTAVAAAGLAGWSLLRSSQASAPELAPTTAAPSESQQLEAKARICRAVETVGHGITINTNEPIPEGPNSAAGSLAVAANARISLLGGGQYLLVVVNREAEASQDLATAVRNFAFEVMDYGVAAMAGAPNTDPAQAERLRKVDALNASVRQLCG